MNKPVPSIKIEQYIYLIRGYKVMLDEDLAELYGVTTKRLNEQVKRNRIRFPPRYMFQLAEGEARRLRSQNATSRMAHGGRRYLPLVFTEHGAIMLACVLNSETAVKASLAVVDAFVRIREMLATHKDLARKLHELENKYDAQFKVVFDAIRGLMAKPADAPLRIKGFKHE